MTDFAGEEKYWLSQKDSQSVKEICFELAHNIYRVAFLKIHKDDSNKERLAQSHEILYKAHRELLDLWFTRAMKERE